MAAPLKYKSEVRPWSGASGAKINFLTNSLPKQGPNGGRLVIDAITAHAELNVDVATAAIQGEDLYRGFRTITVKQRDGALRYNEIPGDAMRVYLYEAIGGDRVKEHADVATGDGTDVTISCNIPLRKRYVHEMEDHALAAELLDQVIIGCADEGEMSLGTSVVTINSGSYWLIFECHEEMDIVYHAVDEVKVQDFESTTATEPRLNVNGRLQALLLFVRGASGGESLANLTAAWIHLPQNMAPELNVSPDLVEYYGRERGQLGGSSGTQGTAISSDPFVGSTIRAAAVLIETGTKCFEQPETDTVVVKTTHTLGKTLTMIARVAKPRLMSTQAAIARKYKLSGNVRVKTSSNSKRQVRDWKPEFLAYLPVKFLP